MAQSTGVLWELPSPSCGNAFPQGTERACHGPGPEWGCCGHFQPSRGCATSELCPRPRECQGGLAGGPQPF